MNESDSPGFNDVLTEWRWWYETIMWPSAPKTFRAFWGKVDSCGLLKLLCEAPEYEKKWKDPLIFHLGEMWMMGSVRGRLPLENEQPIEPTADIIRAISMLDFIIQGLINSGTSLRYPKHTDAALLLLQHFFSEDFVGNWTVADLRSRIVLLDEDYVHDVLTRATACRERIAGRNG
ncbi:MAG: hypothetical protein ABI684_14580 [Nitrospirota bacterium]